MNMNKESLGFAGCAIKERFKMVESGESKRSEWEC